MDTLQIYSKSTRKKLFIK